jgi:hypothetical protein
MMHLLCVCVSYPAVKLKTVLQFVAWVLLNRTKETENKGLCPLTHSHTRSSWPFKYMCYAQRSKTLIGRKKRPQRVLALEEQPQREMSCCGCFKTTTTRCGIRETATMQSLVEMDCL